MKHSADVALRFADDDDMLRFESKLDLGNGNGIAPRADKTGKTIRSWERFHQSAMNEINRRLRSRKATSEPFELGRLDPRSRERLREPAACFALHYLFVDQEQSADPFLSGKAELYWRKGDAMLEAESEQLDYDIDRSGTTDEIEKNQPFPNRVIRG